MIRAGFAEEDSQVQQQESLPVNTRATCSAEFDYAPGQPNLYRMMQYKQDLAARMGIDEGVAEFRRKFGWPCTNAVSLLAIESEHEFAAVNAERYVKTGDAGIPFTNQPPVVHGESNHRPLRGVTRAQYLACLRNTRVRGRSAVVLCDGRMLLDFQGDEVERVDEEFEWDPSIFHVEGGMARYLEAPNEHAPLRLPEAFNLLGAHTDFFGHWMCEYLPKYASAVLTGELPKIPVLIDAHMPASHRQSLEILFPDQGRIIEIEAFDSVCVDRLWVAPDPSYYPLFTRENTRFKWDAISASPQRLVPIAKEISRRARVWVPSTGAGDERVFLARKPFRHRKLVNSAEIEAEMRRSGFRVVYPEDLPFAEQVALVREARYIIAMEGSAAFLVQFAKPGTRFCTLSHPLTEPLSDFNELFAAIGVSMTVFTGPFVAYNPQTPHDSDYAIDVRGLLEFMGNWMAQRGSALEEAGTVCMERGRHGIG